MKRLRYLICLLSMFCVAAVHAGNGDRDDRDDGDDSSNRLGNNVNVFTGGSLETIRAVHAGHAFILAFWSIDCAHCPKELRALGALKKKYPALDIVLVATDAGSPVAPLARFAARQDLAAVEQWVFAAGENAQPEKLRYEIDRHWWGELPRTYFFDPDHRREGVSGLIPAERLERWGAMYGR